MRRRLLLLLGGQAIALGLTVSFLVVPASAVFLHTYGAAALPYAYIVVAIAGVAVSSTLTVVQRRMPLGRLALAVILVHVAVVALGWALLSVWELAWVTFVLIVLFPLSIPTGFLVVGSQAVRLYDVQTLKRDFPRIIAGFSIGFALGGLLAAALVQPLGGATNLLLIDVAMALLMMGLVWTTSRQFPGQLLTPPAQNPRPREERRAVGRFDRIQFLREPLVLFVLGYQVVSAGVTQLLDFIVWERAAAYYADPHSLAQFMGAYGAVLNIVAVTFVLVLAGRLLSRRGIGFGLLANPVAVIVALGAVVVVGAGPGIAAFAYLVAVSAAQIVDISSTDGMTRTSIAATYQGFRRADRLRAQTVVEGAGVPLAVGLVGVLLIIIDALGLDIRGVVWLTAALCLVWLWLAVKAHRSYAGHLGDVLADRSWDPVAIRIDDDVSEAVSGLLGSPDPIDRRTALEVLRDASSARLVPAATHALADPDVAVRAAALEALAAAGALADPEVHDRVGASLGDPHAAVRARAGAALSRGEPGRAEDGLRVWRAVLDAPDTTPEALSAAGSIPSHALVPSLLGLVGSSNASPGLMGALAAHGDLLVPELERGLAGEMPTPELTAIVTAVARSGDERGRRVLLSVLADRADEVAEAAALGLSRFPPVATARALDAFTRRAIGGAVERELVRSRQVVDALTRLGVAPQGSHAGLLRDALADELGESARRLLVLAGIAVPGTSPRGLVAGLASDDGATRGLAEELLEVALGQRADAVLAVVRPGLTPEERRDRLYTGPAHKQGDPSATSSALDVVTDIALDPDETWSDPWLRACALRVLPDMAPDMSAEVAPDMSAGVSADVRADVVAHVVDLLRSRSPSALTDPVVAETFSWLAQLVASRSSRLAANASAEPELP